MIGDIMKIDLPYVQAYEARGKLFTYYRRDGKRIRIKGEPDTAEWKAEYHKIHDTWGQDPKAVLYGSIGWLIDTYRVSPRWHRLKPATQASYSRYLSEMIDRYNRMDWRTVDRPLLIEVQEKFQDSPKRADYYISLFSILGEVAIDKGIRTDNPAKGIKKLGPSKEWRAWEADELLWFEGTAQHPAMRLAYYLALYTGQRQADVLAMSWRDIKDGTIKVIQSKTGEECWIPLHENLAEALNVKKRGYTIVSTEKGQPYTDNGFTTLWRRAILECGLDGVQFHGLRKNATAALAECGCTEDEIMSITGHKTRAMVALYTRSARQKLLAQAAMRKLTNRGSV
ncbi:MAG: tyrosine-type recombinase/integrase [Pseudomonadota bacterium]|nr:tyrosine-type recombinase/integrase [Pseudomonadota bacterium]